MECALPRHDAVGLDVSLAVSHNHKHNDTHFRPH